MAKLIANSGDPDQTPRSAASDLGLHCLPITLLRVSRLQWVSNWTLKVLKLSGLILHTKNWYYYFLLYLDTNRSCDILWGKTCIKCQILFSSAKRRNKYIWKCRLPEILLGMLSINIWAGHSISYKIAFPQSNRLAFAKASPWRQTTEALLRICRYMYVVFSESSLGAQAIL